MLRFAVAVILTILSLGARAFAQSPKILTEEMMVPSSDQGIEIYVRNKRPADLVPPFRHTVLFVHGATWPSEATFDLKLGDQSWVDYVAGRGYDVWIVDVRGYGKSTRPKEMDDKPEANAPLVRGSTAVEDVSSAIEFILRRRNISKINLVGWSWGTVLTATYAAQNPDKVERLVMYAPVWLRKTAPKAQNQTVTLGAYRIARREQARANFYAGVPEDKKESLIPAGWFDVWADANFATDPTGAKSNPPVVRAPNGVLQDDAEYWSAGKPYYDPVKIEVPALLVSGEWDIDAPPYMGQTLFPLLVNSPGKRYVMLAEGTHRIYMEKNRMELFKEVQSFLDQGSVDPSNR